MGLRDQDLRRVASGMRLEHCIKPGNVMARVLKRVQAGEPFLLTETDHDESGTLPMPGAVHVWAERGGQFRWMALIFQMTANSGLMMREARRRVRATGRAVILREENSAPVLLRDYAREPEQGTELAMTLSDGGLELEALSYRLQLIAAHEIVESPYGLVALAGRLKRGQPAGVTA